MDSRANYLRSMQICRFCLTEDGPLTNIYERQVKDNKQTVPLPLQLMACVAIEVFENDGMPQMICKTCRAQTLQAYTFKTNCKKADDALKVYLATGSLVRPWSQEELIEQTKTFQATKRAVDQQIEENRVKKVKRETTNPEVITLNYSANLNQSSENSNTEPEINYDNPASEEQETRLEDEEFMNLEEDSVLNPTLKVNQVKTDCFPCPHCERSFPLKQLLDLHKANHGRERNYNCEECDKAFFTKYDLSKHMLTHTGTKPYSCVVCRKSFSRESLLHRHEKIHIDVPKYLCPQCDRTFLTGEDLDAHTAKHKKKRPFMCKICQKSFVFKQGLERHEQTHSNVKPHKCNYCEASFTSAIKLTRHVTSHAGLRPYPCKMCGRTFLLSHHLTRHMRSHYAAAQHSSESFVPPIGQHKCDICSMSFRRKDSLINHSAIHSMVNLKCVICNTEFDNVNKVKEHITTHLSDLPFPCEKCDYSFDTQEQLEDHELKHAEMEYEEQIEQEVLAEARQAASGRDVNDEENSDYSGDEIAEFTITNDINNPEVVRRSKRVTKIKNYAEFLKDELGSDLEEEPQMPEEDQEDTKESQEMELSHEEETIKPIVRSEGTKVYSRKSAPERPKIVPQINLDQSNTVPLARITQPISSLDSLSKDLSKFPEKEIFNMKIGDKTVTVQKLLLTKEQMKAMAKEGKIEKKGNTLLLKKNPNQSFQNVNLETIFGSSKVEGNVKQQMKKTYQRKSVGNFEDSSESFSETVNMTVEDGL